MVEIPIRKRTDFMLLSADSVDFEEKIGNLSDSCGPVTVGLYLFRCERLWFIPCSMSQCYSSQGSQLRALGSHFEMRI